VIRKRVIVSGLVQGVFFRDTCQQMAREAGVAGWVRNRNDGSVEAAFEGEPERVARMVAWVRRGPAKAHVERVDVYEEPGEGLPSFRRVG
jgi:acylphosphatase